MTDEQRLQAWFSQREEGPESVQRGVARVMSEVPRTRQQGRWLPLPLHEPKPTTNGQAPSVIGRTKSMLSPAKAIIAGTLVFTIGGAFLIALPFGQQGNVPGAAIDPCTTPITPVSGEIVWGELEPNAQYHSTDAGIHIRDYGYVSTVEVDDDRLVGQSTGQVDWDLGHEQTTGVSQGTFRIDNDEGAWEGTWTGIARSAASWKAVIDLTGSGAYEGLSARLFTQSGPTGPIDGSVYPTDVASC